MKPNLLNDVLREGSYAGFREELLERFEAEARRKRFSRASRWLAAAAAVAMLFILNRTPEPQQSDTFAVSRGTPNPVVIRTVPLQPSQILETRPAAQFMMVTDRSRKLESLSDSELLALFPKKPVGLASTVEGKRQFFFLNRADKRRFMSSN